jgi:hypothetical protein
LAQPYPATDTTRPKEHFMNTVPRPRPSYLVGDPHHLLALTAISGLDPGSTRPRAGRRRVRSIHPTVNP